MAAAACLAVSLRRFGGDGTAATGIATGGGAASVASSLSEVVDMFSRGVLYALLLLSCEFHLLLLVAMFLFLNFF